MTFGTCAIYNPKHRSNTKGRTGIRILHMTSVNLVDPSVQQSFPHQTHMSLQLTENATKIEIIWFDYTERQRNRSTIQQQVIPRFRLKIVRIIASPS